MSEFYDLVFGKKSDDYVLFLDLWGTSARLKSFDETKDISKQGDIIHRQAHFINTLARLSNDSKFKDIQTHQLSDCSFSLSKDLDLLLSFGMSFFKNMTFCADRIKFIPVRGGISKGILTISDEGGLKTITNFKYSANIGIGYVNAVHLEKNCPKGMRLFLDKSLENEIKDLNKNSFKEIECAKKEDCFRNLEVNWTHHDLHNSTYLDAKLQEKTMKENIKEIASSWKIQGDEYQNQVADSLSDLLSW